MPERRGERFAVLSAREVKTIALEVYDACLLRGLWKPFLDVVDEARESIRDGIQHILHAARVRSSLKTLSQNFALFLLDSEAEHLARSLGEHA